LEILLEEDRGRARLFCSDEGPGIDPSQAEEVFTGENLGGRGLRLGLGLSRDLTRMTDGDLWVGAPMRSGVTLVLDLPASSGLESEPAVESRSEVPMVLLPKGRLVVDVVQLPTGGALDIELTAIGLDRLARELLSAEAVTLLVRRGRGRSRPPTVEVRSSEPMPHSRSSRPSSRSMDGCGLKRASGPSSNA
jgi:hypothetical protein